jgi:hypothetical protein
MKKKVWPLAIKQINRLTNLKNISFTSTLHSNELFQVNILKTKSLYHPIFKNPVTCQQIMNRAIQKISHTHLYLMPNTFGSLNTSSLCHMIVKNPVPIQNIMDQARWKMSHTMHTLSWKLEVASNKITNVHTPSKNLGCPDLEGKNLCLVQDTFSYYDGHFCQ